MENLNAEAVKKALECCVKAETHLDCRKLKCPALINDECIYIGETDEDYDRKQLADALALITSQEQRIKELAEVVERSKTAQGCEESVNNGFSPSVTELQRENERLRLKDAENAVSAFRDTAAILDLQERLKKTTKENEGLHRICQSYVLQYGTATDKEIFLKKERAETVQKMQERLKADAVTIQDHTGKLGVVVGVGNIDDVAREMLEGEK